MQSARIMPQAALTWTPVEAAQPRHEALCRVTCWCPDGPSPEIHEAFYVPREGRWFLLKPGDYAEVLGWRVLAWRPAGKGP